MMKNRVMFRVMVAALGAAAAVAVAGQTRANSHGAGGMMVGTVRQRTAASIHDGLMAGSAETVLMPLKQTDIAIEMIPGVISADVRQLFFNDSGEYIEASYIFPMPEDATISEMIVTINEERVIRSTVQERKEAAQTYAAAKKAGQRTALLTRNAGNMLNIKIANLAPGDSAEVHLVYFQSAAYDNGVYHLTVPTVMEPQYIPQEIRRDPLPVPLFQMEAIIASLQASRLPPGVASDHHFSFKATFSGMELSQVTSPSHAIAVTSSAIAPYLTDITLADTFNYPDRDVVLALAVKDPEGVSASFLTSELGDSFYTVASVVPVFDMVPGGQSVPREFIFVVDTSGSMAGESLEQAKRGIISALKYLKPSDSFSILEFNSDYSELISKAAAEQKNIVKAEGLVNALVSEGGTEFLPVMEYVLGSRGTADKQRLVLFLTDGQSSREDEVLRKIMADRSGTKIFPISIGPSPNTALLQKMAEMGRGCLTGIRDLNGIADSIESLFAKLQHPVMTDIAARLVDEAGSPVVSEIYPSVFPDIFAGLPVRCTIRHNALKNLYLQLNGTLAGEQRELRYRLPDQPTGSAAVAQIFGQAQITDLESLLLIAENPSERELIEGAILQTALDFQLVCRYTARVAVEELIEKLPDGVLRYVPVPLHTPRGMLEGTASGDWQQLLIGALLLMAATALLITPAVMTKRH